MGPEADLSGPTEKGPAVGNTVRYVILIAGVGVPIVACGGLLGGRTGAVLGLGLGVTVAGASWWFSDRLVIRACGAQLSHAPTTLAMVAELSRRAAMPPPQLYVAPDPQPNAFAIGRTPRRGAIVVTEGLLSLLEPAEVRAVLAHELAHIRRRDTLVTSVVGAIANGVLGAAALLRHSRSPGTTGNEEDAGAVVASGMRVAARLLQIALPSDREGDADRDGSDLTRDPEALARALTRIEGYARVVPMETMLAQLSAWVVDPLGDSPKTLWLFSTDPPLAKRIDRLRVAPEPRVAP